MSYLSTHPVTRFISGTTSWILRKYGIEGSVLKVLSLLAHYKELG
jgi:hypothetical protein